MDGMIRRKLKSRRAENAGEVFYISVPVIEAENEIGIKRVPVIGGPNDEASAL